MLACQKTSLEWQIAFFYILAYDKKKHAVPIIYLTTVRIIDISKKYEKYLHSHMREISRHHSPESSHPPAPSSPPVECISDSCSSCGWSSCGAAQPHTGRIPLPPHQRDKGPPRSSTPRICAPCPCKLRTAPWCAAARHARRRVAWMATLPNEYRLGLEGCRSRATQLGGVCQWLSRAGGLLKRFCIPANIFAYL